MPKKLIGYWILSFFVFTLVFINIEKLGFFSFIIILTMMIYGRYIIRNERNKARMISYKYLVECEPYDCVESLKRYYKKIIQSKRQKSYIKMIYAIIYVDSGDIKNAVDALCSLDIDPVDMSDVERFLYLRVWAQIYFEKNLADHMKKMIDEMLELINTTEPKYINSFKENYNLLLAKYHIIIDYQLDNALDVFEKCFIQNTTLLNQIKCIYYIGVINLKKNNFEKAKRCFEDVIKTSKNKLKVYNDSEKIISKVFTN